MRLPKKRKLLFGKESVSIGRVRIQRDLLNPFVLNFYWNNKWGLAISRWYIIFTTVHKQYTIAMLRGFRLRIRVIKEFYE